MVECLFSIPPPAMLTCWKCGFFISSTTRGISPCSTNLYWRKLNLVAKF